MRVDNERQEFIEHQNKMEAILCDLFNEFVAYNKLPEGDAEELLLNESVTESQKAWLSSFVNLFYSTI